MNEHLSKIGAPTWTARPAFGEAIPHIQHNTLVHNLTNTRPNTKTRNQLQFSRPRETHTPTQSQSSSFLVFFGTKKKKGDKKIALELNLSRTFINTEN
jgi:hypothetical protein